MSGGSLDYVYRQVEDVARQVEYRSTTTLHRAFSQHLIKVSKALHDLEWVLSGDKSTGDEIAAIRAVVTPTEEIETATQRAREALDELNNVLKSLD